MAPGGGTAEIFLPSLTGFGHHQYDLRYSLGNNSYGILEVDCSYDSDVYT